ncbi:DUF7287 family protein [Halorubrum halodurans]|uniref:Uncharacterized protein n=1 Tax=Halorubrum halodurans TaxID=1383851 RepID=A0A256IN19_9EURY|nr:hypothetical protein [Halorubrum halodurans]OYR57970.1 hypothetical protein DJ70_04665 [Halorubrum halodurans]
MSGERPSGVRAADGTRSEARGQTQIDFAVGAGVFLVTLAFVVAFVPTLFEPFAAGETASPLVADRIAAGTVDRLGASGNVSGVSTAVHAPTEPGVLSPACTVAFFAANATLADDAGCPFDAGTDPAASFGVDDDVQVVIHGLDERDPAATPATVAFDTRHGPVGATLNRSTAPPTATTGDVTVAGRVVSLRGVQYRLTVRVW